MLFAGDASISSIFSKTSESRFSIWVVFLPMSSASCHAGLVGAPDGAAGHSVESLVAMLLVLSVVGLRGLWAVLPLAAVLPETVRRRLLPSSLFPPA